MNVLLQWINIVLMILIWCYPYDAMLSSVIAAAGFVLSKIHKGSRLPLLANASHQQLPCAVRTEWQVSQWAPAGSGHYCFRITVFSLFSVWRSLEIFCWCYGSLSSKLNLLTTAFLTQSYFRNPLEVVHQSQESADWALNSPALEKKINFCKLSVLLHL